MVSIAPSTVSDSPTRAQQLEDFAKKLPYPVRGTNLTGVYAMTAMPRGPDVNAAAPSTLLGLGIVHRRPDANEEPGLRALWDSVYNREKPLDVIVPELEVRPGRRHRPARALAEADRSAVSGNWGGAVVNSDSTTGPWASVTGQYTVPTVTKPTEAPTVNGACQSSSWVGIDGYSDAVSSNDVLQIGVNQDVDSSGEASYSAWFEWWVAGVGLTGGVTSISQSVTFGQKTPLSPSLATVNRRLYAAWRGDGNSQMNVMVSNDGRTFRTPPLTTSDTSDADPAICEMNGNLYLAWKGSGNDNLNVAQVVLDATGLPNGLTKKAILGDTSKSAPALCSLNNTLYLSWRGESNDHICILSSADGVTWANQLVSGQNTPASPALGVCNGQLFVAWRGDGNENLNVATVSLDKSKHPSAIDNVHTFGITSPLAPCLAGVNGFLYLGFVGDDGEIHIFVSEDDGASFPVGLNSSETSASGPAMAAVGGQMFISWRGLGNDLLNVAPIIGSFDTYEYVASEVIILNFPINAGDSVTASCTYSGNTSGVVQLANNTTGQAFALTLAPPPGANFNGKCVEWVIETPLFGSTLATLPTFTPLVFSQAFGCSAQGKATALPSKGVSPFPQVKETIRGASTAVTQSTANGSSLTVTFTG